MTVEAFVALGIAKPEAERMWKNEKNREKLLAIIQEGGLQGGCEKAVGNLLLKVVTKLKAEEQRATLVKYIATGLIKSVPQVDGALKYLNSKKAFDTKEFDESCGAGVEVGEEEIKTIVSDTLKPHTDALVAERYSFNLGKLLFSVKKLSPWADGGLVRKELDAQVLALLGPKTEADKQKKKGKGKGKTDNKGKNTQAVAAKEEEDLSIEKYTQGRELPFGINTEQQMAAHRNNTGGMFFTRFPPEPNGYLHIGHAKAMNFNFTLAKMKKGGCILRFDDTNPAAEKQEYIDTIRDSVSWLGFEPRKVTHSSDYFEQLYQLAVKLIRDGNGYICKCSKDEMKIVREANMRGASETCACRGDLEKRTQEYLNVFEQMRQGYFNEGERTLRMKGDPTHPNSNMRVDHVFYRIIFQSHPHAGDKWCVYPTYDYTHCIVDSLEDIDASCCTLEFENRRESYFWLLDVLGLFKPVVWEYSRLNLEYHVMSKRKLIYMVSHGVVRGWDDPRMPTLVGLRRRGVPPEAITTFCNKVGVSRNENLISMKLLESCIMNVMNDTCPRGMAVLHPLKVILTNFPEDQVDMITCPNFPQSEERGSHQVPFSRVVYIDRDDFREQDDKKYYGLAPGKTVHLKYCYNMTCNKVIKSADGEVVELHASVDVKNTVRVKKGHLHWVSAPPACEPTKAEFRVYDHLFKSTVVPDDWLKDVNPDSEQVTLGYVDAFAAEQCSKSSLQFERVGYFAKDVDSTEELLVFNRTISLRASADKKKL